MPRQLLILVLQSPKQPKEDYKKKLRMSSLKNLLRTDKIQN